MSASSNHVNGFVCDGWNRPTWGKLLECRPWRDSGLEASFPSTYVLGYLNIVAFATQT